MKMTQGRAEFFKTLTYVFSYRDSRCLNELRTSVARINDPQPSPLVVCILAEWNHDLINARGRTWDRDARPQPNSRSCLQVQSSISQHLEPESCPVDPS
jgi:hypothetical protein